MALVFLTSSDSAFTVSNNNVSVYDSAPTNAAVVTVNSGVTGVTLDSNITREVFTGAMSTYTFAAVSVTTIGIYSGGTLVATTGIQGTGTKLTFSNGTVNVVQTGSALAAGGVTIGGANISTSSAAPAAVTPTTIDTTVTTPGGSTGSTGTGATGQTFTLTTGLDNVTSAYSTVAAIIDQSAGGNSTWGVADQIATSASGVINLTLLDATTAAAINTAGFSSTGVTTLNIKSIAQVSSTAAGAVNADSLDLGSLSGLTTVSYANSSSIGTTATTLTLTSLASGTSVSLNNNGQYRNITLTGANWSGSADTLNLAVAGRNGAVSLTSTATANSGVETVAITTTGTTARLASLTSPTANVTTVTVGGTGLKVDSAMDSSITSFDASGSTGPVNVYLAPGTTLTSAKGGTGTADILAVNALSTTQTVSGFEKIVAEAAATYDMSNVTGATSVGVDVGAGAVTFTNVAATTSTLQFSGANQRTTAPSATASITGDTSTVTYTLKNATGTADALTIAVDNGGTASSGTYTVAAGALTANGIENITITEADWTAITFSGINDAVTSTGNLTFTASGAANLTLGTLAITGGSSSGTDTFNFANQTGTLSATLTDTNNVTWTGGSGAETITTAAMTVSTTTDTYNLGSGANVVTITAPAKGTVNINGGTGNETFTFAGSAPIGDGNITGAGVVNINGGTSTSSSTNTLQITQTAGATDVISSLSNIQKFVFQGSGAQIVNATVASGYADTASVTFVGASGDTLNITATTGGTASIANYTKLGSGILKLSGSTGGETLTGSTSNAAILYGGAGADKITSQSGINDTFVFASTADTGVGTAAASTSTSTLDIYTVHAGDKIDLTGSAVATTSIPTAVTAIATTAPISLTITAANVAVYEGVYSASANTFTVGTTGANAQYIEWATTTGSTTANEAVILTGMAVSGVGTAPSIAAGVLTIN